MITYPFEMDLIEHAIRTIESRHSDRRVFRYVNPKTGSPSRGCRPQLIRTYTPRDLEEIYEMIEQMDATISYCQDLITKLNEKKAKGVFEFTDQDQRALKMAKDQGASAAKDFVYFSKVAAKLDPRNKRNILWI